MEEYVAYIVLWLWVVGAYMMWEDTYDEHSARSDHDYSWIDKLIHSTTQLLVVVGWPISVTFLIIYQAHGAMRSRI
jgi:hypothetical protein